MDWLKSNDRRFIPQDKHASFKKASYAEALNLHIRVCKIDN
jgi:hypothetical protein